MHTPPVKVIAKTALHRGARAFTLIELLTVIAVMSVLVSLCVPAISSITMGGKWNQSLSELAGTLDQARQYAIAQNTYVWVAMHPTTDSVNGDELNVAVLASKTGTDPSPWTSYGAVPNDQLDLIMKPKAFQQVKLEEAGFFKSDKVPSLPSTPSTDAGNSPAQTSGAGFFKVTMPGTSAPKGFTRVIQFTPGGEARIAQGSVIDVIEFGMHPTRGAKADDNNVAVLRVNGLTGQTKIYRP